jgi:hypothetical protein
MRMNLLELCQINVWTVGQVNLFHYTQV